jgi:predicted nuclease with RNAse H fold
MSVVGLDLAGAATRPTGFCKLTGLNAETTDLFSDEEILRITQKSKPEVVAIDAPLSLPPGRKTIEDRSGEHLRASDRELLRRGIRFFPITLGPMRKLTTRGILLRRILEGDGYRVIEVYPGGAQDVLSIPRKQQGLEKLKAGLEALGITGLRDGLSDHELDAATCAYVGKLFLEGKAEAYGPVGDAIFMPKGEKHRRLQ